MPWVWTASSTALAVARSALRTWTHSRRLRGHLHDPLDGDAARAVGVDDGAPSRPRRRCRRPAACGLAHSGCWGTCGRAASCPAAAPTKTPCAVASVRRPVPGGADRQRGEAVRRVAVRRRPAVAPRRPGPSRSGTVTESVPASSVTVALGRRRAAARRRSPAPAADGERQQPDQRPAPPAATPTPAAGSARAASPVAGLRRRRRGRAGSARGSTGEPRLGRRTGVGSRSPSAASSAATNARRRASGPPGPAPARGAPPPRPRPGTAAPASTAAAAGPGAAAAASEAWVYGGRPASSR